MNSPRAIRLSLVIALCAGGLGCETKEAQTRRVADAELVERLAIVELVDRATDAINHHEWSRVESMLTEDVVWEALPPIGWKLEGLDAVRGFFRKNEGKIEVLLYNVIATSVRMEAPDRATARSTMNELLHVKEKGVALQIVGTYTDTLVKQNGEWRFSRRQFARRYEDDVDLPARLGGTGSRVPDARNGAQK